MKIICVSLISFLFIFNTFAKFDTFEQWLSHHKAEYKKSYPSDFIDEVFHQVEFDPNIIKYDRRQPEFVRSMGEYLKLYLKDDRVLRSAAKYRNLSHLLSRINKDFGVEGKYLISFWALETDLSNHTGKMDLVQSLSTLSFDGRRSSYFKRELNELINILFNNKVIYPDSRILGSWAGAMGSTQFMPSNINKYALDYDGDGLIDMWSNQFDFLASSANFLNQVGYQNNRPWAVSVELASDFDYELSGLHMKLPMREWVTRGVILNSDVVLTDESSSIYLPQGVSGPKFLVLNNFFKTFRWNNSSKYALAIGVMSDLITGSADYFHKFDLEEKTFLSFDLSKDIQRKLNQLGHDVGKVDGIIGPKTFKGIQGFQKRIGLTPDGYLSEDLAQTLLNF